MSFSITNNSANAVVTLIESLSSTYGTFTITSGSFPLFSGQTVSGTNTEINNGKGSPEGSILLFLQQGNAQIEYYLNGNLISANDYSSGLIELKGPIIQSGDVVGINVDEAELPSPSPTPSITPTNTVTPTNTPTNTPSNTPTMTPTPSSTPISYSIGQSSIYYYAADDATTISGITGNIYVNNNLIPGSRVILNKQVEFTGSSFSLTLGTTLSTLDFSATPVGSYYIADDGTSGVYNRQVMSGFTRTVSGATSETYTGVTKYLTGTTLLPYTENGTIVVNKNNKRVSISGSFSVGYFNILPTP
jgi:hypothetical protein